MRSAWLAAVAAFALALDLARRRLRDRRGRAGARHPVRRARRRRRDAGPRVQGPVLKNTVYVTSTRSSRSSRRSSRRSWATRSGSRSSPTPATGSSTRSRFYQALRTPDAANSQLGLIVSSAARRALGQAPLTALLTDERGKILDAIKTEVAEKAAPLGVSVDEVRLRRADLPFETSQAIFDRMKSERQREAKELRAQGYEWAQRIQAKADHDRTDILSEAQRAAAVARGEGDAEANRALSDAFSKDPQFYTMFRALRTYKGALAASAPTMIVSPTPISCGS